MSRRRVVAGNWKMHLLSEDARRFCRELRSGLAGGTAGGPLVLLFPSFTLLPAVAAELAGSAVGVGGQDLHPDDAGAHTGDVSGAQLADAGCTYALAGHSERRHDHGEGDELVGRKVAAAARHGLVPVLCVGETREERRAGRTFEVLSRQLAAGLAAAPAELLVAYEPVWAIGTGDTASPEQAQEAHAFLRAQVGELRGAAAAASQALLYGGSVKPANAAELIAGDDVDGFLVGGASLDSSSFLGIIVACGR